MSKRRRTNQRALSDWIWKKGWLSTDSKGKGFIIFSLDRMIKSIKVCDPPGYEKARTMAVGGHGTLHKATYHDFVDAYLLVKDIAARSADRKRQKEATRKPYYSRVNPASNDFLQSYEWRRVRMQALKKWGAQCQCCGATRDDGESIHVDHIKPRRLYPQLALSLDNLQVLCGACNHGKGNWDMTDWRPSGESVSDPADEFQERFA